MESLQNAKKRALERLHTLDHWDYSIPIHALFNEEERRLKKREYVSKTIESLNRCIEYLWDIMCGKNPFAFTTPEFDVEVTQEGVAKFIEPRTGLEKKKTTP